VTWSKFKESNNHACESSSEARNISDFHLRVTICLGEISDHEVQKGRKGIYTYIMFQQNA